MDIYAYARSQRVLWKTPDYVRIQGTNALVHLLKDAGCGNNGTNQSCCQWFPDSRVLQHRFTLIIGITDAGYSLSSSCLHIYSSVI